MAFYPKWRNTPPEPGTFRSIFKWGSTSEFKHPNKRLYDMIKKTFGMTDASFYKRINQGDEIVRCCLPSGLSSDRIEMLQHIVGPENVSFSDYDRVKYAAGKTAEEAMMLRSGIIKEIADVIVHPRNRSDVQKIVQMCNEERIPLHVFSGGSSVTFGLRCLNGGITMVMSTHMNRILAFNENNQTITVEPGIMGPDYEAILNNAPKIFNAKRQYSGGHFPQSFEYSSVGGWIVTLGSGQQSSYYGDMRDIVISQEYITPAGSFKTHDYPASATGPKINDIMLGSEGAFGVLVSATLKIFRYMPKNRRKFAFMFPNWHNAVNAAREIFQGEFGRPSLFRISDPEETDIALKLYGIDGILAASFMRLHRFKRGECCLCIGHTEGEIGFSKNVIKNIKQICRIYNAAYLTGYPVIRWEHGRFKDPYLREDLNDFGIIIDTLESSVTWDNIHRLHQGVREFIKSQQQVICMTHASHFYPQGTNLYFIFIMKIGNLDEYRSFHAGVINSIIKHGGSLSHHHGIGKMFAPWMESHIGTVQMNILRALKKHFDPNNIMNPGIMNLIRISRILE